MHMSEVTHRLISHHTGVLGVLVQRQPLVLVDELLHRVLNELVEGLELLPDETLLIEEGVDHLPVVLLGDGLLLLDAVLAILAIVVVVLGVVLEAVTCAVL